MKTKWTTHWTYQTQTPFFEKQNLETAGKTNQKKARKTQINKTWDWTKRVIDKSPVESKWLSLVFWKVIFQQTKISTWNI